MKILSFLLAALFVIAQPYALELVTDPNALPEQTTTFQSKQKTANQIAGLATQLMAYTPEQTTAFAKLWQACDVYNRAITDITYQGSDIPTVEKLYSSMKDLAAKVPDIESDDLNFPACLAGKQVSWKIGIAKALYGEEEGGKVEKWDKAYQTTGTKTFTDHINDPRDMAAEAKQTQKNQANQAAAANLSTNVATMGARQAFFKFMADTNTQAISGKQDELYQCALTEMNELKKKDPSPAIATMDTEAFFAEFLKGGSKNLDALGLTVGLGCNQYFQ